MTDESFEKQFPNMCDIELEKFKKFIDKHPSLLDYYDIHDDFYEDSRFTPEDIDITHIDKSKVKEAINNFETTIIDCLGWANKPEFHYVRSQLGVKFDILKSELGLDGE